MPATVAVTAYLRIAPSAIMNNEGSDAHEGCLPPRAHTHAERKPMR